MIPVSQLRSGTTFKLDGELFRVVEYKHTKVGRGNASIRVKIQNMHTGGVTEKTFVSGGKVEPLEMENKTMQFLWQDDENAYFMDETSFEQTTLPVKTISNQVKFLQDGKSVKVLLAEGRPISIELPVSLIFSVKDTEPGVKGDRVAGALKPAILENGLKVNVPLFVDIGDKVKVDTRTGSYIERVAN